MKKPSFAASVRRVALVALAVAVGLPATGAAADEKLACVEAATAGQDLRYEGKLLDAREPLLRCARPSCPQVIVAECTRWLDEVNARIPAIVVRVTDTRGRDVEDATVTLDGKPVLRPGQALGVNPGLHVVRAEHRLHAAVEARVVAVEGEGVRVVTLTFAASGPTPTAPVSAQIAPSLSAPPPPGSGPRVPAEPAPRPPPIVWLIAATGGASLGAFAGFGLSALEEARSLRGTCSPRCSDADIGALREKMLAADLSLGLAIAATASLGVLLVTGVWPVGRAPADGQTGLRF